MKKRLSFVIIPFCIVLALTPFFASTVGAAEEASEAAISVVILDAASSSDISGKSDASPTDIVLNSTGSISGVSITVNGKELTGSKLVGNVDENITFEVSSTVPFIFAYEYGARGLVSVPSHFEGGGVYSYTMPIDMDMTVFYSVKGDCDASGSLDFGDVTAVEQIILSGQQPSGWSLLCSDTNNDGVIDTKDLTAIKAQLYGQRDMSW